MKTWKGGYRPPPRYRRQNGLNPLARDPMDLTRIAPRDRQHIQKYGDTGFTISGVEFESPVLVFAKESLAWQATHPVECREHSELSGLGNMPFVRFS